MEKNVGDVLSKYDVITYYDEIRREDGVLLFCNGHSFDTIEIDDVTGYIVLSSKEDDGNTCMLNPCFNFEIIPLKYAIDKLVLTSDGSRVIFFCKKN